MHPDILVVHGKPLLNSSKLQGQPPITGENHLQRFDQRMEAKDWHIQSWPFLILFIDLNRHGATLHS